MQQNEVTKHSNLLLGRLLLEYGIVKIELDENSLTHVEVLILVSCINVQKGANHKDTMKTWSKKVVSVAYKEQMTFYCVF